MIVMRGISIAHLKRSGGHAVALWLMGHFQNSALSNANTWANPFFKISSWILPDATATQSDGTVRRGLRSTRAGLDPRVAADAISGTAIKKDLFVVSYEDPDLHSWFPDLWPECFPPAARHDRILVLRSFYNHIASRIAFMHTRKQFGTAGYKPNRIQWWKQHAREALVPLYKVILFDKWFDSPLYRRNVEEMLDLQTDDSQLQTVGTDGSGSSFDKTRLNGQAQCMNVLHRHTQVELPKEVLEDDDARELNYSLFGWTLNRYGKVLN